MAECGYCSSIILTGGVTSNGQRFCGQKCLRNAQILSLSDRIPPNLVDQRLQELFHGNCPKCRGPGPIEVHRVHRVWSAVVLTGWSSGVRVCCRSCATKSQLGGILFSALFGWWGVPWGLVLTPVQITRNVLGMCRKRESTRPSAELRKAVLVSMASELKTRRQTAPPPLPGMVTSAGPA